MTETTYHIVESALFSCVEIIKRTTTRSAGLGALIPPSSTSRDQTLLSVPYRSTRTPAPAVVFNTAAEARQYAEKILTLTTNH